MFSRMYPQRARALESLAHLAATKRDRVCQLGEAVFGARATLFYNFNNDKISHSWVEAIIIFVDENVYVMAFFFFFFFFLMFMLYLFSISST